MVADQRESRKLENGRHNERPPKEETPGARHSLPALIAGLGDEHGVTIRSHRQKPGEAFVHNVLAKRIIQAPAREAGPNQS